MILIHCLAKAGFGKTFISYSVVKDLVAEAEDPELCDEPPTTAFFHFSGLRPECSQPEDAFRNMACQLLQAHRYVTSMYELHVRHTLTSYTNVKT